MAVRRIDKSPLVSIGIPVYNGENFLGDAVGSVLGQTEGDLELLISDNASTDRTEEVCRDLAAGDRRIVYRRQERNVGAAANYNHTFAMARGRYFKWLAHDDRIQRTYLERTIAALEAEPDAVLCNTVIDYIEPGGRIIGVYETVLAHADLPSPSERFGTMVLRAHSCADMFGVMPRRAMLHSLLHSDFHGADRALLAQMALRGRLIQLPEHLVQMREHAGRYTRSQSSARDRRVWHDPSGRSWFHLPTLRLYHEYWRMVRAADLPPAERRRCYAILAQWWMVNWNSLRVTTDAIAIAAPEFVGWAEHTKKRFFGAAPGHFDVPAEASLGHSGGSHGKDSGH